MRDFFIGIFAKILNIIVIFAFVAVVIGAVAAYFAPVPEGSPLPILRAIIVLIGGALYVSFMAGALYLGLGVYHNTRRSAELLEALPGGGAPQTTRLY